MFKRLYSFGGTAYVVGGLGVLAMLLFFILFGLFALGVPIPDSILKVSGIGFLVGGMIVTTVFNSGSMQVVAQNHTTEMLQKISQQLAEQAEAEKLNRRDSHRLRQRKQAHAKPTPAPLPECVEVPVAEVTPQEGYVCPVTKTFIPVRGK